MCKTREILRLCVVLVLLSKVLPAQVKINSHAGGSIGLVAAFGNRFDRIGICFKAYYLSNNLQLNGDLRFYGNIKNLGPQGFYPEGSFSLGIVYGFGRKDTLDKNPFLSTVSNQTGNTGSIGYAYTFYLNEIGTRQPTGTVSIEYDKFNLIGEDDLFAHPRDDRFRTGAVLVQYTYKNITQFGLNASLWTGQMGKRVQGNGYPYAIGYLDTTGGSYCNYSHGLLSVQAKTMLPLYNQPGEEFQGREGQLSAGIDAEQVRNAIQNRFFHDMIFLPASWRNTQNADIPMLDEEGQQYLYQPGQKIRKPDLYLNSFLNPGLFY
jgi:hypothetical protein